MSAICVRHGLFLGQDRCPDCREAREKARAVVRRLDFEHRVLAVRFLCAEAGEVPLCAYVYAFRGSHLYGRRWAYTVVLVDMTKGSEAGEALAGVAYRTERPMFTKDAVAEEFFRVAGVYPQPNELEVA